MKRSKLCEIEEKPTKKLALRIRCGGCLHLRLKAPQLEAKCSSLGKTAASRGCQYYNPDYSKARYNKPKKILEIAKLVQNMDDSMKCIIAYSIINSVELAKTTHAYLGYEIEFGEEMALNLSIPRVDYVNCWVRAMALGITKDRKSLIFVSKLNKRWVQVLLPMHSNDYLSIDEYKDHVKLLKKKKLLKAPKKNLTYLLPIRDQNKVPQQMSYMEKDNLEVVTRKAIRCVSKPIKSGKNIKVSKNKTKISMTK